MGRCNSFVALVLAAATALTPLFGANPVVVQAYQQLTEADLKWIAQRTDTTDANGDGHLLDPANTAGLLEPILKVRLPGTPNSAQVRAHFEAFFNGTSTTSTKLGTPDSPWRFEVDAFQADTPVEANVSFANVVATRDPPGAVDGEVGRLTLVAHYDSKREPDGFIGAVDSAVPCALIMWIVKQVDAALTAKWASEGAAAEARAKGGAKGLQVLFLDGEEAFKEWTATDSVYGARHLATAWDEPSFGPTSVRRSRLDSIDLFVLLDLLGAASPRVPSYYKHTDWAHRELGKLQTLFQQLDTSSSSKGTRSDSKSKTWFPRDTQFPLAGQIGDDHLPFFNLGVPVLHLIPIPFPAQWHKMEDDAAHLEMEAVREWARIMGAFVAGYMEVGGFLGK